MRVYVHGNCQAPAIASLLAEVHPDWTIRSYEVFGERIIEEIEEYHATVAEADVIICQPVHDGYRGRDDLSSSWVRANAASAKKFITYPSMFFDGQLVGWRSVGIPGYAMPYQDMVVLHCVALGMTAEHIIPVVSDEDLYPSEFIEQEIELSIAELERRESVDSIDVPLSPFLRSHSRKTRLFHVSNHPYRQALVYIANAVLEHLGMPGAVPYLGRDCIPIPHVPLPAPVQRYLRTVGGGQADWEIPSAHDYHLPKERLSRAEYVVKNVRHLRSHSRAELLKHLNADHVVPLLRRLAVAAPRIPGIDVWHAEGGRALWLG